MSLPLPGALATGGLPPDRIRWQRPLTRGARAIASASQSKSAESAPPAAESADAPDRPVAFRWRGIVAGAICAYLLSVGLGFAVAKLGLGDNLIVRPLVTFVALFIGGWLAGWMARVASPLNGCAVGIVYIVGWAVQNAIFEGRLVEQYGLSVLPRMNILGILLGDFLILIGAASGGWVAELWRHWRGQASRPRTDEVTRE